jgi:hypothetical protein
MSALNIMHNLCAFLSIQFVQSKVYKVAERFGLVLSNLTMRLTTTVPDDNGLDNWE